MTRTVPFDQATLAPGAAMSQVRKLAAMTSRGKDIEIRFGSQCSTDGKVVNLPDISDKADPHTIKMLIHGMYHEMSHVHHSDFKALRGWISKTRGIPHYLQRFRHMCGNALEDVRIEALVCSEYPGVKIRMHTFLKEWAARELNGRFANPQVPMVKKLLDASYLIGRDIQFQADGKESLGIEMPDDVKQVFDKVCLPVVQKVAKTSDQGELFKLADELYKNLKDLLEEPLKDDGQGSQSEPLKEGEVVRLKKGRGKGKYGIVTKLLGNGEFEVKEVTKEEAKAHLKGE